MNKLTSLALSLLAMPTLALAAESTGALSVRGNSLTEALLSMVVFALVGTITAIGGYRLFDKFTPGDLHKEIIENKNVAVAIIAAAVILGVCLIVAAAIVG